MAAFAVGETHIGSLEAGSQAQTVDVFKGTSTGNYCVVNKDGPGAEEA